VGGPEFERNGTPAPGAITSDRPHQAPGFAISGSHADIGNKHRKPIELSPAVARNFVCAALNLERRTELGAPSHRLRGDAIAAELMAVLRKFQAPRERPLHIVDVREMFLQMRDQVG
jgi:uncharacterized protein YejL (UPF0352 family)